MNGSRSGQQGIYGKAGQKGTDEKTSRTIVMRLFFCIGAESSFKEKKICPARK